MYPRCGIKSKSLQTAAFKVASELPSLMLGLQEFDAFLNLNCLPMEDILNYYFLCVFYS